MRLTLNLIFALATFIFFAMGAFYLQSKSCEKYVEIFSDEYV